jgi:hypothetical protein
MFEFTTWHASFPDFFISLRHYTVIGKQLLLSNDRNRVRGAVLSLSQDGASTHLFENFRENSLKRDLSNDTTANTPLFSLANTFKGRVWHEKNKDSSVFPQSPVRTFITIKYPGLQKGFMQMMVGLEYFVISVLLLET